MTSSTAWPGPTRSMPTRSIRWWPSTEPTSSTSWRPMADRCPRCPDAGVSDRPSSRLGYRLVTGAAAAVLVVIGAVGAGQLTDDPEPELVPADSSPGSSQGADEGSDPSAVVVSVPDASDTSAATEPDTPAPPPTVEPPIVARGDDDDSATGPADGAETGPRSRPPVRGRVRSVGRSAGPPLRPCPFRRRARGDGGPGAGPPRSTSIPWWSAARPTPTHPAPSGPTPT